MVDDIKRVESTLGGADREQFQNYLSAYERMSDRQTRLVEVEESLRRNAPRPNDKYTSTVETDRLDAQLDIAAATLISGLSNVVTLASGVGNQYFSIWYRGLGIEISKHGIGHGGSYQDWTARDMATMIHRFHMQLLARLMDQLNAVPEGDGTMLDNTLIVYLSDAAESHHSRCWEWPFVVIDDLGGCRYAEVQAKNGRGCGRLFRRRLSAASRGGGRLAEPLGDDEHSRAQESRWAAAVHRVRTPPTVYDGTLCVAIGHEQTVVSLDPKSGKEQWRAHLDGRIDSPPTPAGDSVFVGTRTGWVYSLDRGTGQVRWRFLAAPHQQLLVAHGQAESSWPVFGSVLLHDGFIWAAAGRQAELDHGIYWYGLDPASGEVRKSGRLAETKDWHEQF